MQVEFDGDLAARVAIEPDPNLAVSARAQKPLRLVAGHFRRRPRALQTQVLRPLLVSRSLLEGVVGRHRCATLTVVRPKTHPSRQAKPNWRHRKNAKGTTSTKDKSNNVTGYLLISVRFVFFVSSCFISV